MRIQQQQQNQAIKRETKWKVGSGDNFRFWEDPWPHNVVPLMEKYQRLYQIAGQQKQSIRQMGSITTNGWEWKLVWRRALFDCEVQMADNFLGELSQLQIQPHKEDKWIWKLDRSGYYSTQSGYNLLWGEQSGADQNSDFADIWKLKIPAKSAVFAWRLIRDRLPTKLNLSRRQVMVNDLMCPFCGRVEEEAAHLFFNCNNILPLWWESLSWVDLVTTLPQNPKDNYLQHVLGFAEGKKLKRWRC